MQKSATFVDNIKKSNLDVKKKTIFNVCQFSWFPLVRHSSQQDYPDTLWICPLGAKSEFKSYYCRLSVSSIKKCSNWLRMRANG